MTKMNKDFDCVEMQDKAALRIYEILKDKTREEELDYWRTRNELLSRKYPKLRELEHTPLNSRPGTSGL